MKQETAFRIERRNADRTAEPMLCRNTEGLSQTAMKIMISRLEARACPSPPPVPVHGGSR